MQIVAAERVPWSEVSGHRSGRIEFRRLLRGEAGTPGNFELSIIRTLGNYYTPRHRHNFDQIRYGLSGVMNYAPGKDIVAGSVCYFPEGSFYGPQDVRADSTVLLLQFGGASGDGFMSYEQLQAGHAELAGRGAFADGVYSFVDAGGSRRNQDGYEAVWEHVHGRPIAYPEPRFAEPVLMWPERCAWVPASAEPGVATKLLGSFTERRIEIACVRLASQAAHRLLPRPGAQLLFVLTGSVIAGAADCAPQTALLVSADNSLTLRASQQSELLVIGLPVF